MQFATKARSLVSISTITTKDVPASNMPIQLSDVRLLLKVKSPVSVSISLRVR